VRSPYFRVTSRAMRASSSSKPKSACRSPTRAHPVVRDAGIEFAVPGEAMLDDRCMKRTSTSPGRLRVRTATRSTFTDHLRRDRCRGDSADVAVSTCPTADPVMYETSCARSRRCVAVSRGGLTWGAVGRYCGERTAPVDPCRWPRRSICRRAR
jgi:hypothetical protein